GDESNQATFEKNGFDVGYNKEIIYNDRDKDLVIIFDGFKILLRCKFRKRVNVRSNDIDMFVTTLQENYKDHVGFMVSNKGYGETAKERAKKFKIHMCRTENLVKRLLKHVDALKLSRMMDAVLRHIESSKKIKTTSRNNESIIVRFENNFNFELTGWCPKNRKAEDGKIDKKYPMCETTTDYYSERTEMNVCYAEATLILLLLGSNIDKEDNICKVYEWIIKNDIKTLNVGGPREST
ncbi:20821_t:CDS:2, partial [Gigaspora margarita]